MKMITKAVRHPQFNRCVFNLDDDETDNAIAWFFNWIEKWTGVGDVAIDQQQIQLGWTSLLLACKDQCLTIYAPDFKSFPLQWTDNISNALRLLAHHKYFPESYGLQADIPEQGSIALVGELFDQFPMFMTRSEKDIDQGHSGWFIASSAIAVDNTDESKLRLMSLYEVYICAPHLLEFLSMPVGTQIVFDDSDPVVLSRNKEIKPQASNIACKRQNDVTRHVD